MKIKILFLIHDLMHGGAEKVLVNLVNNMDREKFDITVMTLFDVGVNKQFLASHIHYTTVWKKMFRGNVHIMKLFSPKFLYRYCIKENYDILVSYLEGPATRIISGCNNDNIPKIAWRHAVENEKEFVHSYRTKREVIKAYNKFDIVVGVSKTVVECFEQLSGITGKSEVKYNTNETEKIKCLSIEKINNDKFILDENINICGVGKLRYKKGYMRLAQAHKKLWDEGYKFRTYVLGEGEEKAVLEKFIRDNHMEDSFILLGYDTNPYKYVSKCDLFVCPSFEEGFSTATTEALIVGTPVLTTLCSGMKEMLGDNEYGVIVENSTEGIYKGIKYFLEQSEMLEHYTKKAEIRGNYFCTERTVQAIQDMFFDVLEKRKKCQKIFY